MIAAISATPAWGRRDGCFRENLLVALAGTAALMLFTPNPAHSQAPRAPDPQFFELPSAGAAIVPPPAKIEGGFRDPSSNRVQDRIVGGQPTTHDAWPSLVVIHYRSQGTGFDCDGTVIASDWVLTAGHCAGGNVAGYVVTEGTDNLATNKGRDIGVTQVIRHEGYNADPPYNDIALLHLKSAAQSPAQILIGETVNGQLTSPGTLTSVAGFGYTKPQPIQGPHTGPSSNQLLQIDLPVVDRASCTRILGKHFGDSIARFIDDATICAGDPSGAKDACNGDSGGPLILNAGARHVQIGVVSWGPGCAQRDTVGVYAAVGHFETWIKRHVPGATFYTVSAQPGPTPSPNPSAQPGPHQPAPSASSVAAIESVAAAIGGRADIHVDLIEGNRAQIGSSIHFRVTSPIAGQLLVYNIDLVTGVAYQVFPNRYSGGDAAGATKSQIGAGANVTVPNPSDRFDIRVKEPRGKNRLYAFVLPPHVRIGDLAEKGMDMHDLLDPPGVFNELADRALRGVEVVAAGRVDRGAATYEYEIVK